MDGSDIDLSSTDDEYENDDVEYVPEPTTSSSNSELGFSHTDEPDTIPSTSSSTLLKQLKGKKKKKPLSATTTASAIEKTLINWTGSDFIPGNIEWEGQFHIGN